MRGPHAAAVGLWLVLTLAAPDMAAATVTVDVTRGLDIGGPDVRPTLFGITAFEGFPTAVWDADFRARLAALRLGAIRFPAALAWCSPPTDDLAWYGTDAARATFRDRPLFGDRYVYGRFLPVVRELGALPIPCLSAPPAWMVAGQPLGLPQDWDQWARHAAAYLTLWRQAYPDLAYVQVWNEPNADFWKDQTACQAHGGAGGLYADFFNATVRGVRTSHPELKALGPVLCWPPAWPPAQKHKKPWYTWEEFTRPFLERTVDTADAFDFHAYDIDPADLVVQASLVYAQSLELRPGRPLRSWLTESNYGLTCEPSDWDNLQAEWQRRALPYERFLLTLVDHQDLFEGNLYHDLRGGGRWCLFNRQGQETGVYGVFRILRNLRGRRLVATSDDPEVRVAAACEPERLTVIAFNDSDASRPLTVRGSKPRGHYTALLGAEVLLPPRAPDQPTTRARLDAQWASDDAAFTVTVALPPRATAAFYIYPIPAFAPRAVVTVRQVFGEGLLQSLAGEGAVARVRLPLTAADLAAGAKVSLRVGLMGETPAETYRVRVNGNERPLASVALQEIPAAGLLHAGDNAIEVSAAGPAANPARALGFVSAVIRTGEE